MDCEMKIQWSSNVLEDLVRLANFDYGVAFESSKDDTTTTHHFYHRCPSGKKIKHMKIVYVDFTGKEQLIPVWSKTLQNGGAQTCSCEAREFCGNSTIEHNYAHVKVADFTN
jgi:hypothetical protein